MIKDAFIRFLKQLSRSDKRLKTEATEEMSVNRYAEPFGSFYPDGILHGYSAERLRYQIVKSRVEERNLNWETDEKLIDLLYRTTCCAHCLHFCTISGRCRLQYGETCEWDDICCDYTER